MVSISTGRVEGGKVILDDDSDPLPDGVQVTVVIMNNERTFELTPEEDEEIADRIANDELVPFEEVLLELSG